MICKCGNNIPGARIKLGYKTCVDCSSEQRWGVNPLTFHKTGNTVEVIKDPELAEEINNMAQRRNYGVMKGVTGSYKRRKHVTPRKPKFEKVTEFSKEIGRKQVDPANYQFHEVLSETGKMYEDGYSIEEVDNFLSEQIKKLRISPAHKKQIITLIEYVNLHTKKYF